MPVIGSYFKDMAGSVILKDGNPLVITKNGSSDDGRFIGNIFYKKTGNDKLAFTMDCQNSVFDKFSREQIIELSSDKSMEWKVVISQLFSGKERRALRAGSVILVQNLSEKIRGFLQNDPKMLQKVVLSILEKMGKKDYRSAPTYFVYFGDIRQYPMDTKWYQIFRAAQFTVFRVPEAGPGRYLAICSSEAKTADKLARQASRSEPLPAKNKVFGR